MIIFRKFEFDQSKFNDTDRTVQATISTEFPVERFKGNEILDHSTQAIDLSREPLPLIESHDSSRVNIGIVENLKIEAKKLRGTLRFGTSERASEIWEDIKAGIIRYLSIGYEIMDTMAFEGGFKVIRWQPLEVSIVSVPADPGAQIGRSKQLTNNRGNTMNIQETYKQINKTLQIEQTRKLTSSELSELHVNQDYFDRNSAEIGVDVSYRHDGAAAITRAMEESINLPVINTDPKLISSRGGAHSDENRFRSFGEQLLAIRDCESPGGHKDERLFTRATGLSEGVGTDGGFLIQSDFSTQLLKASGGSVLDQFCTQIEITNGYGIDLPVIDETSRATGSRWGGAVSYWTAEAGEKIASKPSFGKLLMKLKKLIGLCYTSDELLQDVSVLERIVSDVFKAEIGFRTDDGIINGTGAGEMLGIMNAPATITQDKEAGQAANSVIFENVTQMWSRLWAKGRGTSVWLINQSVEPALYTMSLAVGTGGGAVFLPGGGASAQPYMTLFGRPIIVCESCQQLGTAGDIILADLSSYIIARKGGIQEDKSIHVRFIYDESVFRFVARLDGQPMINSAISQFKGTDSVSPFITLETRS